MKQGLHQQQKQRQELKMAPRMIQSLRFLQSPLPALQELVRAELEQNPVLEEKLGGADAALVAPESLTAAAYGDADQENDFDADDYAREIDALERMLAERPAADVPSAVPSSPEAEQKRQYFLDSITAPPSLHAHLMTQLNAAGVTAAQKQAGEYIIGNVDENGWLAADAAEIAREADVAEDDVRAALAVVQEFDPPGVAARSLQECLLLQLRRAGHAPDSLPSQLVSAHLAELGTQSPAALAKAGGWTEADTATALKVIAALDPKPGAKFSAPPPVYVTPEVEIRATPEGGYAVDMLRDGLPRLHLSGEYTEMLQDPATAADAKKFLQEKLRDGQFVLDSLHQRRQTIRRIAEEIAVAQQDFFAHGISKLQPLTMGALAAKLGLHETTVGRAVSGKYVRTPQGVFELKFFFTPSLKTADGGAVSTVAVREAVRRLIVREDICKPLSDQAIADALGAQGLPVARRTVAKYREELGLPPAHKRKATPRGP